MDGTHIPPSRALALAAIMVSIALAAGFGDDSSAPPTEPAPDRFSEHAAMIQQMRAEVTPAMVARMNSEDWSWMRDPAHLDELEAHIAQVHRATGTGAAGR